MPAVAGHREATTETPRAAAAGDGGGGRFRGRGLDAELGAESVRQEDGRVNAVPGSGSMGTRVAGCTAGRRRRSRGRGGLGRTGTAMDGGDRVRGSEADGGDELAADHHARGGSKARGGGADVGALPPGSAVAEATTDGSSAVLPGQLGDGRVAAEGRSGLGRAQAGGGAGERATVSSRASPKAAEHERVVPLSLDGSQRMQRRVSWVAREGK